MHLLTIIIYLVVLQENQINEKEEKYKSLNIICKCLLLFIV